MTPSKLAVLYGVIIAMVGVGLGLQIGVCINAGMGWWKVGIGVFAVASLIFTHLSALRRRG
jgi:hypothetical protein